MKRGVSEKGSFLIELMIVVAVVAFLAMLAVPNLSRFFNRAKRTEAYVNLSSLYAAQKAYWAEHGCYSAGLWGENGIGWKPEGYSGGGKTEKFYYTYGFPGQEGRNHFTGKLETGAVELNKGFAGGKKFLAIAVGDINHDGKPDIIAVNENNDIVILQDAIG
ncbi:hypothetical protein HN446_04555 [bacterium]|jgi:type II secretory pathway pseudopilin PulG|nr:hypothetical protein [bacterium]